MVSNTMFKLNLEAVKVMMIHRKRPSVVRNIDSEELVASFHFNNQSMAFTKAMIYARILN
jgi:hypothetical protein